MTPPEEHQPRDNFNQEYPPVIKPLTFIHPMTPPKDSFEALVPNCLQKYEALFKESIATRKEHKGLSFTPLYEVERVPMSNDEFLKLHEILRGTESESPYPCISFNSYTLTEIIKWMPSDVHEVIASTFIGRLEVALELLPSPIAKRISATGSQEVGSFNGKYQGSKKQPEVLFRYEQRDGNIMYTCTIEIGLSETYEKLVEDVKLWIEGNHDFKTVILFNIEEFPSYRSPTCLMHDDEIAALNFPHFFDLKVTMFSLEDKADFFSPLQMRNLTWVGRIHAFLEIWKANPTSGQAERQDRKYLVGVDNEVAELNIKLSDLYPLDATGGNHKLPFTWQRFKGAFEIGSS